MLSHGVSYQRRLPCTPNKNHWSFMPLKKKRKGRPPSWFQLVSHQKDFTNHFLIRQQWMFRAHTPCKSFKKNFLSSPRKPCAGYFFNNKQAPDTMSTFVREFLIWWQEVLDQNLHLLLDWRFLTGHLYLYTRVFLLEPCFLVHSFFIPSFTLSKLPY